jgi:predicted nucleic acid-binding protein
VNGFLLDTNIPSELTKPRPEPRVVRWLELANENEIFISVVTLGEIRKGCALLDPGKRRTTLEQWLENDIRNWFANRILPVDDAIAECWGRLDAKRQQLGKPLNTADGLIAATAIEHELTVVTHNVEDFDSLDVSIVNPWV